MTDVFYSSDYASDYPDSYPEGDPAEDSSEPPAPLSPAAQQETDQLADEITIAVAQSGTSPSGAEATQQAVLLAEQQVAARHHGDANFADEMAAARVVALTRLLADQGGTPQLSTKLGRQMLGQDLVGVATNSQINAVDKTKIEQLIINSAYTKSLGRIESTLGQALQTVDGNNRISGTDKAAIERAICESDLARSFGPSTVNFLKSYLGALARAKDNPTDLDAVSTATFDIYLVNFGDPERGLHGAELDNAVGMAMGMKPDNSPQSDNTELFSGEQLEAIRTVTGQIEKVGGKNAKVSVTPVMFDPHDGKGGVQQFALWRVTTPDNKDVYVDFAGRTYNSVKDFADHNKLGYGRLVVARDGPLTVDSNGKVGVQDFDKKESGWDKFKHVGGMVLQGLAIAGAAVLTVAAFVGTGGIAAPLLIGAWAVVIGGGLLAASEGAADLYDRSKHGQSTDLNKETLPDYINIAAGLAAPIGGGASKATGILAARGLSTAATATRAVGFGANAVGVGAGVYSGYELKANWNNMSGWEQAEGVLNAGMFVAGSAAGGYHGAKSWSRARAGEGLGKSMPADNSAPYGDSEPMPIDTAGPFGVRARTTDFSETDGTGPQAITTHPSPSRNSRQSAVPRNGVSSSDSAGSANGNTRTRPAGASGTPAGESSPPRTSPAPGNSHAVDRPAPNVARQPVRPSPLFDAEMPASNAEAEHSRSRSEQARRRKSAENNKRLHAAHRLRTMRNEARRIVDGLDNKLRLLGNNLRNNTRVLGSILAGEVTLKVRVTPEGITEVSMVRNGGDEGNNKPSRSGKSWWERFRLGGRNPHVNDAELAVAPESTNIPRKNNYSELAEKVHIQGRSLGTGVSTGYMPRIPGYYHGMALPKECVGWEDARVAKYLLERGLPKKGDNYDLYDHARYGSQRDTAYIGTTQHPSFPDPRQGAVQWGEIVVEIEGPPGWYVNGALDGRVRIGGKFATIESQSWSIAEGEIATFAEISPEYVKRVGFVQYDEHGNPIHDESGPRIDWYTRSRVGLTELEYRTSEPVRDVAKPARIPVEYPKPGTLLSQQERLKIFNQKLMDAPAAGTAQEGFNLLSYTMHQVEDSYSGVQRVDNPPLKYEGRMYPPRSDYITLLPDGSMKAVTKGNIIKISPDGTINIYAKEQDGSEGRLILHKPGRP